MTYRESKRETDREQERLRSTFHAYAYQLFREGYRREAVTERLIAQGVEKPLALDISSFADISYHASRRDALQSFLGKGLLFFGGGLLFTLLTYALAAPGGIFVIATGAIAYGLFQLLAGLLLWVNKTLDPEGSLRIATCLVLLPLGLGLILIAEIFGNDWQSDFVEVFFTYWALLIGGYLLVGLALWGLVDKRAMRLRTGDPEIDALTPQEVGKAGKFLLIIAGVIVLHLIVSNLFLRSGDEGGVLSTLFSPFNSPLVGE
jgi:hypothetical protein